MQNNCGEVSDQFTIMYRGKDVSLQSVEFFKT